MSLELILTLLTSAAGGAGAAQLFAWLRGRNMASVAALRMLQQQVNHQRQELETLKLEVAKLRAAEKETAERANAAETAIQIAAATGCNCGVAQSFAEDLRRRLRPAH